MIDAMRFSHYSDESTLVPRSVPQQNRPHFKPHGLWVSVDGEDDWPSWCRSEQHGDIDSKHRFQVTVSTDVLVLSTVDELLRFTDTYGVPYLERFGGSEGFEHIDWLRVSQSYPGIIIAPYQWSLRLDNRTSWYYPWDCASGCIWDASVVTSVTRADHART